MSKDLFLLERENGKLRKQIAEQDTLNRNIMVFFLIVVLFMGIKIFAKNRIIEESNRKLNQYKIFYEETINDSTYKAVMKCQEADSWTAECIAWELNHNGRKENK